MTPEELRLDEAKRWLALAGKDLRAALLLVTEEPTSSVFHSQQGAEKSAKALLALHNVVFRRTHDLTELGNQCAMLEPSLTVLLNEAADLTEFAIIFRNLDAPREPETAEAEAALVTARRLFEAVSEIFVRAEGAEPGKA